MGSSIFEGCSNLTVINIPGAIDEIPSKAFKDCSSIEEFNLPNSIKSIGSDAFNGCASMAAIVIPTSVKEIGSDAFNNCNSLNTVVMRSGTPCKIKKDSFSKTFMKEGTVLVPNEIPYRADPKSNWAKFRNIMKDRKR